MKTASRSNTLVPWAAVRHEYENSLITASALAKKYNTTSQGVGYHIAKGNWQRPAEYVEHGTRVKPMGAKLKAPPVDQPENGEYLPVVGATHLTSVPISDDIEALEALRHRIISQHKVSISRDMAYLDVLEQGLMEKKSAPLQKLNALQTIVKIRGQLVELERQAHSIAAGTEGKGTTNVQVNVNVSPQDAYRSMLEGK